MKNKIIKWLLPVLIFAVACSDENDTIGKNVVIEISDNDIIVPSSGKTETSSVVYSNQAWTLSGDIEWLQYDVRSGEAGEAKTVYFQLADNEGHSDRNINLTFQAGSETRLLTITQKQKDAILFSKDKIQVPQKGGNMQVLIEANVDYIVSIPQVFRSWISDLGTVPTKALTAETRIFKVEENKTPEGRDGFVLLENTEKKMIDTIRFFQVREEQLILTKSTLRVPLQGVSFVAELKTNVDYDITIPSEASWIRKAPVARAEWRTDRVQFIVDEYTPTFAEPERRVEIIIKDRNSTLQQVLTVIQMELDYAQFDENSTSKNIGNAALDFDLDVISNTPNIEITVPYYEGKWLQYTKGDIIHQGGNLYKVKLHATENPPTDIARAGVVILEVGTGDELVTDTARIYQSGRQKLTDVQVLDSIYKYLNDKWFGVTNGPWAATWGYGVPAEERYGVETIKLANGDVRVTGLDLGFNPQTTGGVDYPSLPNCIGDLDYLDKLIVGIEANTSTAGKLSSVPASIGNLTQLTHLEIYGDVVFPDEIGLLTNLKVLSLCTRIAQPKSMTWLADMVHLEKLKLYEVNEGTGDAFPDIFGNMTNMTELRLGGPGYDDTYHTVATFGELPESMGNLTNLKIFTLRSSKVKELPLSFSNLTNLEELVISRCVSFERLPDDLGDLKKLKYLRISHNLGLKNLPSSTAGLSSLVEFNFSGCTEIEGEFPPLANMPDLTTIYLTNSKVTGVIPEGIVNSTKLTRIELQNNRLTGPIPDKIGNLVNLTYMDLRNNRVEDDIETYPGLTGKIPESVGNLTKLSYLFLSFNSLSEPIPNSLGGMTNLEGFYLNDNQLSGAIPGAIFGMPVMKWYHLHNNKLETLPGEISQINQSSGFVYIFLSNNNLSGELPVELTTIKKKIHTLDLRDNNLTGQIPSKFGFANFSGGSGDKLHLDGNRLSGPVPSDILDMQKAYPQNITLVPQQNGYGFSNFPR